MKTVFISDHVQSIHAAVLKSIVLILALLPVRHTLMQLWLQTEGGSQIVVGFVAISVFSALSIVAFIFALLCSNIQPQAESFSQQLALGAAQRDEQQHQHILRIYQHIPMLFLMTMMSYLSSQL